MIPILDKKNGEQIDTVETRLATAYDDTRRGIKTGDLLSLLISRAYEAGLLVDDDLRECRVITGDEMLGHPQMTRMAETTIGKGKV